MSLTVRPYHNLAEFEEHDPDYLKLYTKGPSEHLEAIVDPDNNLFYRQRRTTTWRVAVGASGLEQAGADLTEPKEHLDKRPLKQRKELTLHERVYHRVYPGFDYFVAWTLDNHYDCLIACHEYRYLYVDDMDGNGRIQMLTGIVGTNDALYYRVGSVFVRFYAMANVVYRETYDPSSQMPPPPRVMAEAPAWPEDLESDEYAEVQRRYTIPVGEFHHAVHLFSQNDAPIRRLKSFDWRGQTCRRIEPNFPRYVAWIGANVYECFGAHGGRVTQCSMFQALSTQRGEYANLVGRLPSLVHDGKRFNLVAGRHVRVFVENRAAHCEMYDDASKTVVPLQRVNETNFSEASIGHRSARIYGVDRRRWMREHASGWSSEL
ncbi:hypothetical protein JCM10212_001826 [Sporobolomyces blumeae]